MSRLLDRSVSRAQTLVERTMMPDSCAIQSLVGAVSDGAGGQSGGTWTTQATVKCQATTASSGGPFGQEEVIADGITEVVDATIIVPAGTVASATQRIVHTDSRTGAVTIYKALSVSKPTGFELNRTIKGKVTS